MPAIDKDFVYDLSKRTRKRTAHENYKPVPTKIDVVHCLMQKSYVLFRSSPYVPFSSHSAILAVEN